MKVVVIGGSSANVGKTTFGVQVARQASHSQRSAALIVDVQDRPVETNVRVVTDIGVEQYGEADRYLTAGVAAVICVTVSWSHVRHGLAAGLWRARVTRPDVLIIDSTAAGIEMKSRIDSYFIAGTDEWTSWAYLHRNRADHVLSPEDVRRARLIAL